MERSGGVTAPTASAVKTTPLNPGSSVKTTSRSSMVQPLPSMYEKWGAGRWSMSTGGATFSEQVAVKYTSQPADRASWFMASHGSPLASKMSGVATVTVEAKVSNLKSGNVRAAIVLMASMTFVPAAMVYVSVNLSRRMVRE